MQNTTERKDVYSRITAQIVEHLEKGVRPWIRPWNAEHAAGRITRPLRHNGQPYSGINILSLWMSALTQNFAAPIWITYRQATELNAHVQKREKGSLVVYANAITRTEHDDKTGQDVDREIPYMRGYTVFNVEQIEGLPEIYYAKVAPTLDPLARIDQTEKFFASMGATLKHGGNRSPQEVVHEKIREGDQVGTVAFAAPDRVEGGEIRRHAERTRGGTVELLISAAQENELQRLLYSTIWIGLDLAGWSPAKTDRKAELQFAAFRFLSDRLDGPALGSRPHWLVFSCGGSIARGDIQRVSQTAHPTFVP